MSIFIERAILGENYEQCLKDFIKYLKDNGEEIHCLYRTVFGNGEEPMQAYISYLKNSPCKYSAENLKNSTYDVYIKEERDSFDQEYLDNWCKIYNVKNEYISVHRKIYTINYCGYIVQYDLDKIRDVYNINADTISQDSMVGLYIKKYSMD